MNGKLRFVVLVVMVISMLLIMVESASACSCALPGPPDEELAQATAVFAGKVVGISKPIDFGSSQRILDI